MHGRRFANIGERKTVSVEDLKVTPKRAYKMCLQGYFEGDKIETHE